MASYKLVTRFYLLTTFKAFLEQSEPRAADISLLQPRKILTMHNYLYHMSICQKECMVKSYCFCFYKVALWAVLKNNWALPHGYFSWQQRILLMYLQGQITTFSPFFSYYPIISYQLVLFK